MRRSLLLLLAGLTTVLSAASCGPGQCSAATCTGCCDSSGVCQPGNLNNVCGASGAQCQACSGGFTCQLGGCGVTSVSGGSGGGSGGQPANCLSTDRNVGQQSVSPGMTIVPLGSVAIDKPITLLGQAGFESSAVGLCLPNDTVSVALYAGTLFPGSWRQNNVELMNVSSGDELIRWITPEFFLPKGPEVTVQGGRHELKLVAQFNQTASPVLAIRRGARANLSKFRMNIIFVAGHGLTQAEIDAVSANAAVFNNLYAAAGVAVLEARGGSVANPDYAVVSDSNYSGLFAQPITPDTDPLFTDAVNLYFVRQITSAETAGSLLGQSVGIPGAPGVSGEGAVVVSLDAHRQGGALQTSALWTTVAHELGHWHGLRHTTERTGRTFDLIADTPECGTARDTNSDGLVRMDECQGYGSNNMMFWTYDLAAPPTSVTSGQAFALTSALTMVPR